MYRLLALLIFALPLQVQAQGNWAWALTEPGVSYNINPTYPRQVIGARDGKLLWGVLLNHKMSYRQSSLGDYSLQLLNDSGKLKSKIFATGKLSLIQAESDREGNWYLLGSFYDSVILPGGFTISRGTFESEYFMMRLQAGSLSPDWIQVLGGNYYCSTPSFAIGKAGIYLPIDSGSSTFICRIDPATGMRTTLWEQKGYSYTSRLDVDAADNVYLSGSCLTGRTLDFNGTISTPDSNLSYRWYIARYHSNGQHHWHHWMGDISCVPRSFQHSGNGHVLLSGTLWDSTWLAGFYFFRPPHLFNSDFMQARLDSDGILQWAQQRPPTAITQGLISFSSIFHRTEIDTNYFLFCETNGISMWGNGVTTLSSSNRNQATLVGYGFSGMAKWARLVEAGFSSAQQITSDGRDLWVTGIAMDSNSIKFDSLKVGIAKNVYVPYVAKLSFRKTQTAVKWPSKPSVICQVWPNPAHDLINLKAPRNATVRIHDITGRIVWSGVLKNESTTIQTTSWPRGTYILDVQLNDADRELTRLVLD